MQYCELDIRRRSNLNVVSIYLNVLTKKEKITLKLKGFSDIAIKRNSLKYRVTAIVLLSLLSG